MEYLIILLQTLLDGIMIGGVYAVLAIGLSLVFGVMHIVNFAHAEFMMIGMFIGWACWHFFGLDPMLGAFIALAVTFGFGMVLQRVLIRPVLGAPQVAQIFLTVGMLFALENAALMIMGAEYRSVTTPYQTQSLTLFSFGSERLLVGMDKLYAFLMALLSGSAVWLFLNKTRFGAAMRATSQDPMAAKLMGVNTDLMYSVAFGLGVGTTAFGGSVVLPYITASPAVGSGYAVLLFTVVVLGGLGSVTGAIIGGIAVGVIQSFSALFMPIQLQNLALFVVFILVLALRPEGIVARRRS